MFTGDEKVSRRKFLVGGAKICATTAAMGMGMNIFAGCGKETTGKTVTGSGAKELFVRALGGAYQEAEEKAIFTPFFEATGIKIVPVPATAAQVITMVESGKVQLDVLDLGSRNMMSLEEKCLEKIDYDSFKLTNISDIDKEVVNEKRVGNIYFSTVMVYSKEAFPDKHPMSWKEFWDVQAFPGARTLADVKSGSAELEYALLADGLTTKEIYPIDVERAFKSLSKIKPYVVKWWDTGAVSAELLNSKEAVLGGLWNGRVQDLIAKGAPLAIEWSESKLQAQDWAVVKGAPHKQEAMQFIDFALQPKIQAELSKYIAYGLTNKEAFKYIDAKVAADLPSAPDHMTKGFIQNDRWWMENYKQVSSKWNSWILEG